MYVSIYLLKLNFYNFGRCIKIKNLIQLPKRLPSKRLLKIKNIYLCTSILLVLVIFSLTMIYAASDNSIKQCRQNCRNEFKDSVKNCNDIFHDTKSGCNDDKKNALDECKELSGINRAIA